MEALFCPPFSRRVMTKGDLRRAARQPSAHPSRPRADLDAISQLPRKRRFRGGLLLRFGFDGRLVLAPTIGMRSKWTTVKISLMH